MTVTDKKAAHATHPEGASAPQNKEAAQAAQPPIPAAAAPGAGTDAAVAHAPQAAAPAPQTRDGHAGHGGLYRRNPDGTRSLIKRTERA